MSDKMEENALFIHSPNGQVEKKLTYKTGGNKRLTLDRNIFIPAGSVLTQGPTKIEFKGVHMELTIGIGANHTAHLFISEEAMAEIKKLKSETLIF